MAERPKKADQLRAHPYVDKPLDGHRSDKELANTIWESQSHDHYFPKDLRTESDQNSTQEWHDKTTELLDQSSYRSPDAAMEIRESSTSENIVTGEEERVPSDVGLDVALRKSEIFARLAAPSTSRATRQQLVCEAEFLRFSQTEREALLELLWQCILDHRNSNDSAELVAVGSAIRKFAAIVPMDRMGKLAALLEAGHRSPLPIELEIEVAKMVYRNFEVLPPVVADPQPELAQRFWEMVQAYINPRVLLRDKHSAATSLAIAAIVSMRSPLAEQACQAAVACPYQWFAELVSDDLDGLDERWSSTNADAAAWLRELRNTVMADM